MRDLCVRVMHCVGRPEALIQGRINKQGEQSACCTPLRAVLRVRLRFHDALASEVGRWVLCLWVVGKPSMQRGQGTKAMM